MSKLGRIHSSALTGIEEEKSESNGLSNLGIVNMYENEACVGSLSVPANQTGDDVDIGMSRDHDLTKYFIQGESIGESSVNKKNRKEDKKIYNDMRYSMDDMAKQDEEDNWIRTASIDGLGDKVKETPEYNMYEEYEESIINDKPQITALSYKVERKQNNGQLCKLDLANIDDTLSRKRNLFKERSQSSNNLIRKQAKSIVPNVNIEKAAQIVETRPKSHHFLWTIPDPGSQKLKWHKAPLSVFVVKKIYDEDVLIPFKNLISWLIEDRKMIVYLEKNVLEDCILSNDSMFIKYKGALQTFREAQDDLNNKIDFIICLGGDGTLLHASTLFQQSCPPVMAFHQGSLGFLTPFSVDNFESKVEQVLDGNASLLLRYRLKCVICKEDSDLGRVSRIKHIDSSSPCGKSHILVLNEVVIDRGSSSFICNIDVYVEGRLVTSVQGDGLIISTPTGSTAYAVAAGASMIHPNVPAIMITPICPHSLSFRPIVVPAGVELKIMLSPDARNSAMVSFDGRNRQEIKQGDSVRITTAQFPLPAVCAKDQIEDWFDRLAECLHWNVRKNQKSLNASRNTSDSSINNHDMFTEEYAS